MIRGAVNARYEAVVRLRVQGPGETEIGRERGFPVRRLQPTTRRTAQAGRREAP
jgi:hypothetical protein